MQLLQTAPAQLPQGTEDDPIHQWISEKCLDEDDIDRQTALLALATLRVVGWEMEEQLASDDTERRHASYAAWMRVLGRLYDRDLDMACDPNGYITSIVDVTLDA